MSDHIGPAVAAEVARRAQHPYADHPAALILAGHIAAIGVRAATSRAVCECGTWRGAVCNYPAHLTEVLDQAGLLAGPVAVTVEEAPEGDPGMEAVQAWFRNGGRCCGAHHFEGCTDGGPGCCPRCPINPWPTKDQAGLLKEDT